MIGKFLRQTVLLALAVPCLTATTATIAAATDRGHAHKGSYAIGLWGDMPYSDLQAQTGIPNLIADMNAQNLAFTVFDGDWKAGGSTAGSVTPTTCSDALYFQSRDYLNQLKAPATATPGDNDWVDCDRASNGGFNSLERLNRQREILFNTSYTLGQRRLKQEVQATYVENRRWTWRGVTYVTLNIQGSCNNLCDIAPDPAEYKARNAANITWLKESFAIAKNHQSVAVMIIAQANPGWDLSDPTRAPLRDPKTLAQTDNLPASDPAGAIKSPDGFQEYLLALRSEVIAFRKPVAYVHGDSHYHRIDQPFLDAKGQRLENFTRIETIGNSAANGNNDVHWLKVMVDPRSREVFSYQRQVVPANRVAVPAP